MEDKHVTVFGIYPDNASAEQAISLLRSAKFASDSSHCALTACDKGRRWNIFAAPLQVSFMFLHVAKRFSHPR